jgi:hypothetical protein
MVVNHPIDPRDRVTMAEMRSMVIGTKGLAGAQQSCASRGSTFLEIAQLRCAPAGLNRKPGTDGTFPLKIES